MGIKGLCQFERSSQVIRLPGIDIPLYHLIMQLKLSLAVLATIVLAPFANAAPAPEAAAEPELNVLEV